MRRNAFRASSMLAAALMAAPHAAALMAAPNAAADTQLITDCPKPTTTGGVILSDSVTECAQGGDYQYNAAPAPDTEMPAYPYPWDDEFYGPALIIGGIGAGAASGGGGHGGGAR